VYNVVIIQKEAALSKYTRDYCMSLEAENIDLKEKLYVDALTKLPNMLQYDKDIKTVFSPKIVLVDIDAFSDINEYYGRDVGDYILKKVADSIKKYAYTEDMIAYRVNSDKFILLGHGALDIEKYETIATDMVNLLKTNEIKIPDLEESIVIDSTIGFCLEDKDTLDKALIALDFAKKSHKDFACYLHNMATESKYKDKLKYAKLIKKALDNDKVMPYFQPIFGRDAKTHKYEALSRMEDSDGKIISPGIFMGTSKEVRLYNLMAKQVIDKSFKKISATTDSISINLLASDMMDANINNYVIDKIREYKIEKQVVFEILEDESIENEPRVEKFIAKAKRLGIRIAIDDFGTGYSNFSYLLKLKPDYLKIDGSIIKNIDKDKNSEAIVAAIVSFAKTLHIKTIAEFIHSQEVYDKCHKLGVDEFQGFYLGEPQPYLL